MTRKELAIIIAENTGVTVNQGVEVVGKLLDAIIDAVAKGDTVELRGFGVFKPVIRKAKKAQDIGRGKQISIPQHVAPKFKASKYFKDKCK